MTTAVIETIGLEKHYGKTKALHDVTLAVNAGEAFGFIGPNGAGKSTTIRCLLDLLRPTDGTVRVLGVTELARHPEVRARIGYLPGDLSLDGKQTAREHLQHLAAVRGGRGVEKIVPLADRFQLDLDRPFRGLSKGNKQKVGVVQAFMHEPELLILDEPTSGLDPLLQKEFLTLVNEARSGGATVFISSHILSEVEAVAERVGIIREGRIIDVANVETLRAKAGQHISFSFESAPLADAFNALDELSEISIVDKTLKAVLKGSPDRVLKAAAKLSVTRWQATDRNLEDLFMDHYRVRGDKGTE